MQNYTLKQKLKAKFIVNLEINGLNYPQNYTDIIKNLCKHTRVGELKISEALQVLEHTVNDSSDLNDIYTIFATTEEDVKQIQIDLKNYIKINKIK